MSIDEFQIIGWLQALGVWGILFSFVLSVIISILGVIPSIFLSGVNVILFGSFFGFMISWGGEILGAVISFWLYRKGVLWYRRKRELRRWSLEDRLVGVNPRRQFFVILIARITPIVPSGLVTFLAAATSVPFYIFCIASLIGKMPSVAIETLIAHDILFWGNNKIRLVVSALLILLLFLLLKRPQSYRKEV
uniref:TVP38/TMEM64 family protein n=1 Tax=Paenibacillus terrae TaxID=159743 RepID=UPI0016438982|nr:VTT domain-containing protein [Paenibacillus terrae]